MKYACLLLRDSIDRCYPVSLTNLLVLTDSYGSLPPHSKDSFDIKIAPRCRTTSLPIKNSSSGKRKDKPQRQSIKNVFSSASDVRSHYSVETLATCEIDTADANRRHSESSSVPNTSSDNHSNSPRSKITKSHSVDDLDDTGLNFGGASDETGSTPASTSGKDNMNQFIF